MQKLYSNATQEEISEFYKRISANIRILREERGISQLDLALEIGIKSVAFYSNCENCRYGKHFNLEHCYKIAKALEIDLKDIFSLL
ncbi:helix-turn-helix transcriptional regulator [Helicobacter cinaedi]|uniref:DNA-binding helix-turn-helix protein n=1 Tax=Helicobacter cinaedi CCUG 18818 = ATCC BAA-847 TaxID=537971 RepID=A0AAI8MPT0_9HELI|nr:helix-turn-helix transcriptional regulator [Helicobacter cinaedi]EFR46078.1 DNA-binding helix-turn-helix protein [Helicobacter cinaedi CCUG 18818 = ATCC BAA-847]QOQ90675.1 helix-turn-helix transcriptional regulator [Helicobacter cinaedi]BAM33441.1 helix-turn-helix domain-containing protein [Helicobacter cinaedi CCUG 18818 = ATCC BAA-847]BDB67420.1 hypothetical protein Hc94105_1643 [Helicobacter cinaedi]